MYLTIPACRAAPGKVNITVQEQLRELEAFTDSDTPIPTAVRSASRVCWREALFWSSAAKRKHPRKTTIIKEVKHA